MSEKDFRNTVPLDPVTEGHHERLFKDLLTMLMANDVPTYFDQVATLENPNALPWDGRSPRRVMEPAQRFRWIIAQFAELKRKNQGLTLSNDDLEKRRTALAESLVHKNEELVKACKERDDALRKIADMMLEVEKYKKLNLKPFGVRGKGKAR